MKEFILIVEDQPDPGESLAHSLYAHQYDVEYCRAGKAGLERASQSQFDLIILDLLLPSINGLELCRTLRQLGLHTPVLMLSARGTLNDKVVDLRHGADDYMTKPFEMEELIARVEALLRRSMKASDQKGIYEISGMRIDFKNSRILRKTRMTDLSDREADLLRYLIERRGEVLTRDELLRAVWGYDSLPVTRTVDMHVASLRRKLGDDPREPRLIVTVHGQGYRFESERS